MGEITMKKAWLLTTFIFTVLLAINTVASSLPLMNGSSGEEVKNIQERLIEMGFLSDAADGVFGENTEDAVIAFQEEKGLETTGVVDEQSFILITEQNKQFQFPPEIEDGIEIENIPGLAGLYAFGSGAGAMGASLEIDEQGFFTCSFTNTNAGETGDGYAGTVYQGACSGQFSNFVKGNETLYKLELVDYKDDVPVGTEEIKDNLRYVYTDLLWILEGKDFMLYQAGTSKDKLPEELQEGGIGYTFTDDKLSTGLLLNTNTDALFTGPW